jgi:hypothetical protein
MLRFLAAALVLGLIPAAAADPVLTACGAYTAENGTYFYDDLTVHDDGTVTSSDHDIHDYEEDPVDAAFALAADASDGDFQGGGYVHVSSADGSLEAGTDQVLWDDGNDGIPDPNPDGRVSCA